MKIEITPQTKIEFCVIATCKNGEICAFFETLENARDCADLWENRGHTNIKLELIAELNMSVSDAYWAGYNDYCNGCMINPYDSETDEYKEWELGQNDAAWDE